MTPPQRQLFTEMQTSGACVTYRNTASAATRTTMMTTTAQRANRHHLRTPSPAGRFMKVRGQAQCFSERRDMHVSSREVAW